MKPAEVNISKFVNSPAMTFLLVLAAVAMLLSEAGLLPADESVDALITAPPSFTVGSATLALGLTALGFLLSVGIIALVNRGYGILRTSSSLYVGLFALALSATPGVVTRQMTGIVLCVVVLWVMLVMCTIYQRQIPTRRIFFVFAMLTAGSFLFYGFAWFLPVMLVGCAQMRCMSLRSLLAAVIGIVTPVWILVGFSVVELGDFVPPVFSLPSVDAIMSYSLPQLVAIGATALVTFIVTIANTIKAYGLNARTRAFNGILATLTLWTVIMTILDLGHALIYFPLLGIFAAVQLTMYSSINVRSRSYLLVLAVTTLIVAIYVCNRLALI